MLSFLVALSFKLKFTLFLGAFIVFEVIVFEMIILIQKYISLLEKIECWIIVYNNIFINFNRCYFNVYIKKELS